MSRDVWAAVEVIMPSFTQAEISYHDRRAEEEARLAATASPGTHLHEELARFHRVRSALIASAIAASRNSSGIPICGTDKEG
jgi:hypothetical protein